jgi:hypothetical protein
MSEPEPRQGRRDERPQSAPHRDDLLLLEELQGLPDRRRGQFPCALLGALKLRGAGVEQARYSSGVALRSLMGL